MAKLHDLSNLVVLEFWLFKISSSLDCAKNYPKMELSGNIHSHRLGFYHQTIIKQSYYMCNRRTSKAIKMYESEIMNFLKRFYLFIFRDAGSGGRERDRERVRERIINVWLLLTHPLLGTWPATQACALTGNRTRNPSVHRPALNPLSHTSQGGNNEFFKKMF